MTGKLFDETGDRLAPSHSRSKTGARLRYYISHRLIARSGEAGIDGWRLPAPELESAVATLVRRHLDGQGTVLQIVLDCPATELAALESRLQDIAEKRKEGVLELVARAQISPGNITIALDPEALANNINIEPVRIAEDLKPIEAPFQTR